MNKAQQVTVLGSTGSIGGNTLDVLARHPERYRLHALTGHTRLDTLASQCQRYLPERAVVSDAPGVDYLARALGRHRQKIQIDYGMQALCDVASRADTVMAAIVGSAGLLPVMAAARAGRRILLANKEALVMAGQLLMDMVARHGATLLPIDSEHNAIFQCLPTHLAASSAHTSEQRGVERIILTASGGPFRCPQTWSLALLAKATPEQACAHPKWHMGRKISVDSATMMNKGLEVIEAHWLFGLALEQIEVVIHPQSVIHSLVAYRDGSMLAQLGNPDMRTPIAHALAYPERIAAGVAPLDLIALGQLNFESVDRQRFPCLGLAYSALTIGKNAPTILNAANEIAVAAFLQGNIGFMEIAHVVEHTLNTLEVSPLLDLDAILQIDAQARACAQQSIQDKKFS